jgi:peptide/nickel transport system permease protein
MALYLLKRGAASVLTLVVLTLVVFIMGRTTGDPTGLMLSANATQEQHERLRDSLGLDEPLHVQYGIYMKSLLRGDMGRSVRSNQPVETLIAARLPASVKLAAASMVIVLIAGIPLGVVAAVKRGTKMDAFARGLALIGQSAPSFLVGIVLIQVFAVKFGLLPASGIGGLSHYVLPAFTLSLFVLAGVVRLVRSSMLEVLDEEYIKFARTKGVPEFTVTWKHALRNALIPVATFSGLYFAILVTLAIVVEVVFAWPGIGRLAFEAILFRDFPVLQGVILVGVGIVLVVNFTIDMMYAVIDPRARVGAEAS